MDSFPQSLRRLLPIFVCSVFTLSAAHALQAQPAADTFEEETSVVFVEVSVRVIRDGQAVEGLGPGSFEIFDEGEPRPLAGFEVIEREPRAGSLPEQGLPSGIEEAPLPSEASSRRYLFLFDLAYSDGLSLSKAMAASRSLVETDFRPGDQGAVAFFSALRGLRLVAPPTGEARELSRAFDLLEAMIGRLPDLTGSLHDELEPPFAAEGGTLLATREEVVAEAGILVRADPYWPHRSVIRGLARELAALPGEVEELLAGAGPARSERETHLLFLSRGFDPRYLTGRGSAGTLGELEDAFGALRRRGWAIQGINIAGLRGLEGRETLFFLAHETGGESFENFNDTGEAFSSMLDHNRVTYRLVFRADDVPADGRFRRLRVKLRDVPGGARVVHRPGYYAPDGGSEAGFLTPGEAGGRAGLPGPGPGALP